MHVQPEVFWTRSLGRVRGGVRSWREIGDAVIQGVGGVHAICHTQRWGRPATWRFVGCTRKGFEVRGEAGEIGAQGCDKEKLS